jgi:hypothetical protein
MIRTNPGSIRDDQAALSNLLEFAIAAANASDIIRGDASVFCRSLLIPSTFVSGQRTR